MLKPLRNLASYFVSKRRPRTRGVYALIGMPYSGSTILSFLLGSHSKVYNGADLHHLNPERRGSCSVHKDKCPVWTETALERAYSAFGETDRWYDTISEITGRPIICDASKQLSFYDAALPSCKKPLCLVLLKKHPLRSAASDVYNRLLAKQVRINSLDSIHDYFDRDFPAVLSFIDARLQAFSQHYTQRSDLVSAVQTANEFVSVKEVSYESLVDDSQRVVQALLGVFSMRMEPRQLNYTEFEHHPITGNLGPIWKARGDSAKGSGKSSDFRRSYYLGTPDLLILDNKYQELFNQEQIQEIQGLDSYSELVATLGYAVLPD